LDWSPAAIGDYEFTARVTDGRGGEDLQTWTVSVIETNVANNPPTLDPAGPFNLETDRAFAYTMVGADLDQQQLMYQLVDDTANGQPIPPGMSIDSITGELRWTPTESDVGSHTVLVRVIDGHSGYATQSVTFNVSEPVTFTNQRPSIPTHPLRDAFIGQIYRYDVDAIDLDGDLIMYSLASAPEGMSIDAGNGVIGWHPQADQTGRHTVIVKATDELGGIDLQSYDRERCIRARLGVSLILGGFPGISDAEVWHGERAIGGAGAVLAGRDQKAAGERALGG
jgi:hypothetical protein